MEPDDELPAIKMPKINPKKYPLLLACLLVILLALIYIAFFTKAITTVTYTNGLQQCNETYINGKLSSDECPLQFKEGYPNYNNFAFKNVTY